jgi:hypothetical protein
MHEQNRELNLMSMHNHSWKEGGEWEWVRHGKVSYRQAAAAAGVEGEAGLLQIYYLVEAEAAVEVEVEVEVAVAVVAAAE